MKIKVIAFVVCIIMLASVAVISASAYYSYGSSYTDRVSTVSIQCLPVHTYERVDIGASNIQITSNASTNQEYYLSLMMEDNGVYRQVGNRVIAGSAGVGGSYYWMAANSTGEVALAYVRVEKKVVNNYSLGGYIETTSRTWR